MKRRMFKAAFCGACAGCLMVVGSSLFNIFLYRIGDILGSADKLPSLTKLVAAMLAQNDTLFWCGIVLFVVGYGWLLWLDEPALWQCVLHGLLAFVFLLLLAGALTRVVIIQDIQEWPQGYVAPPLFRVGRDFPWLAICGTPLLLAALNRRMKRRAMIKREHPHESQ
jgi:hypothetical protein